MTASDLRMLESRWQYDVAMSNRPFVITIGNAGGVSFELNGRPLPAFGASGTVISGLVLPPEGARPQ